MDEFRKEFIQIQYDIEETQIKNCNKKIKAHSWFTALHVLLVILSGSSLIINGGWLGITTTSLWTACVIFDLLTIRNMKRTKRNSESKLMDFLKDLDPKRWKQEMREKKFKRIIN